MWDQHLQRDFTLPAGQTGTRNGGGPCCACRLMAPRLQPRVTALVALLQGNLPFQWGVSRTRSRNRRSCMRTNEVPRLQAMYPMHRNACEICPAVCGKIPRPRNARLGRPGGHVVSGDTRESPSWLGGQPPVFFSLLPPFFPVCSKLPLSPKAFDSLDRLVRPFVWPADQKPACLRSLRPAIPPSIEHGFTRIRTASDRPASSGPRGFQLTSVQDDRAP